MKDRKGRGSKIGSRITSERHVRDVLILDVFVRWCDAQEGVEDIEDELKVREK